MPLVLGVDSSHHATTVELRDSDDGRLYGSGRAPHPPVATGTIEQDPAIWWQALVDARHDAGGALGVAAVSVAAQQPGLLVLDHEGRLIRAARVGPDRAAARDAKGLIDVLGPAEWAVACGSVPDRSFGIAKLAWLKRTEPDAYAQIAAVLQPHDWLTYRLSRKAVTDRGDASGTGYWSPRENRWRPDLLALVDEAKDWGACLPKVLGPEEAAGDREGVVIGAGTGDAMGAALGLALEARDVVVDLGPSGKVFTVRERPTEDPAGGVIGLADATGRYLPLVTTPDAQAVIESFARVLNVDVSRFDQLAMSGPAGANGLVLVPALEGRLPGRRRAAAAGVLAGIRTDVTPESIARAVVEGLACALVDALDALRDADVPTGGRLFLMGQGARSHSFQSALANIAQRAISVPKGDRIATGACVQAAAVLRQEPPTEISQAWGLHDAREVEPDSQVDAEEILGAYRATRDLDRT